jgi:hypothetical protein
MSVNNMVAGKRRVASRRCATLTVWRLPAPVARPLAIRGPGRCQVVRPATPYLLVVNVQAAVVSRLPAASRMPLVSDTTYLRWAPSLVVGSSVATWVPVE